LEEYYRRFPDGRVIDLRYKFASGDKVRVVSGPHAGNSAEISSRVFIQDQSHPDANNPGYHITLEYGRWVTVKWDSVERHGV